jgi:homoserine dehydrogenase
VERRFIGIGLLGVGGIGGGVAAVLAEKAAALAEHVGCPLELRCALVRDRARSRPGVPDDRLTTDPEAVLADPAVDIVVEVLGGEEPARTYIERALAAGKHVVTANKEVIAKFGPGLLARARERQVGLLFEASVGGGIPLIAPFRRELAANDLLTIEAIINGTTNYILTEMDRTGASFGDALAQAQALGYAEPDPTNDVEGIDAAYKLAILATLGFHSPVHPDQVYREGITRLSERDFRYAGELGYAIKLLAIAKQDAEAIEARVHPALVAQDLPIAKVDGVFNAVQVDGDLVGRLLFFGRGAGPRPTTSAILADVLDLASAVRRGQAVNHVLRLDRPKPVRSMAEVQTRFYLRLSVADRPGVFAQIAQVFAEHQISIASVIQKESDESAQTAEIVIMTHRAREASVQAALGALAGLPAVVEVGNFVRVESQ